MTLMAKRRCVSLRVISVWSPFPNRKEGAGDGIVSPLSPQVFLGARVGFAERYAGLARFKQQRRGDAEHCAESARQMRGVRKSRKVSRLGQARSTHRRIRCRAEAAP